MDITLNELFFYVKSLHLHKKRIQYYKNSVFGLVKDHTLVGGSENN